jgi:hypothetical protein
MLRIDETSKTLVAPQPPALVPEPAPGRDELHALLSSGWEAFAAEIGQPRLRFLAAEPAPGVDLLAFDETAGRVATVTLADGGSVQALAGALAAAADVAAWDATRLAAVHEDLQAAVPGDSPRIVLVMPEPDAAALATMDWLVRRHGLEISAYVVRMLRFGAERLLDVGRVYPAPDPAAAAPAAPDFFAAVAGQAAAPGHSAPPPGVPAP